MGGRNASIRPYRELWTMSKRILIVCRRPPYGSSLAREAIDLALASSVFDQQLAVLFLGDGVLQLLKNQHSISIAMKNHGSVLSALPLYDLNDIYLDQQALSARGMSNQDLILEGTPISTTQIAELINQHDIVLNF